MTGILLRRLLRRSPTQISHVSPVPPSAARGLVAQVYEQVEHDFGMLAPPVVLHSPAPEVLAACWLMLRETLLAAGATDGRPAREAVAAAVSLDNACPYCVDVHGAALYGLVRGDDALAIAGDRIASVTQPELREIATWARRGGGGRLPPWFVPPRTAELVGVAVTFHYINRMVNVFLGDSPLPPDVPAPLRGALMRLLGRLMRPTPGRPPRPGASLGLLPAAAGLPGDLAWAAGDQTIAEAFARAACAIEAAGERSVPGPVRDLVRAELSGSGGGPAGLSRAWVDEAAAPLDSALRPAARLALLTAMAAHQIAPADIDAFRHRQPGDDELIELTAWASLAAARHAGARLSERARR
jgi:AhpD family alkylhydroperoxidase